MTQETGHLCMTDSKKMWNKCLVMHIQNVYTNIAKTEFIAV